MGIKSLVKNGQQYVGQFVATSTFNDRNVIAHGDNPEEVMRQAQQISDSPVVFFLPKKDTIHVF